ncbi:MULTISPECIES: hypothetical protein [Nostoc]|uniref:Uncharacterized protein n=1 Tax=Nostoc paludosum FACHB-159 TaxID=2692908 RepID=A0ABR8KID2_9NOSO|nr:MULTISPECIES: hypothetical protein [Nostoc]MBD2682284.1 hypothetical protein [Nostoc sp. FACHB-857]MBD2738618.1 hypothetical protein [Nostoc paludosum FACHB-159]
MTTVKDPLPNFQLPPHNEAALEMIREAIEHESALALAAGSFALGTGSFISPFGWVAFALAYKPLVRIQKLARLEKLTAALLDEFKSEEIQVFPVIKVEDKNPIDLFIRFPRKTHLFISIRSKGDSEIIYNEKREILQVKRKNKGGLRTWEPCPLVELADYKSWFDKNRNLFGMSSREAQKTPTAKVLVLWPPTKAADDHNSHLFSEVGGMKTLALRRKGTAFVIQQEEITEFIKAWLAQYK